MDPTPRAHSVELREIVAGRYRLERSLGRSGMAEVFEATDLLLRRRVAIKRLSPATMADATARARFAREARALARVSHPNVVTVFDAVEDEGRQFLVMELIDGTTLREVLDREHRLDPGRVASIASGICSALEAVHARGIVHRDVKPSNVFLTTSGAVKLGDFGIASVESDVRLTRTGEMFGSAPYVAPEQVMGGPVDARTDLYALACVMFEMATGRLPFVGDDPAALAYQHVHVEPVRADVLAPWVPAALAAEIDRMMSKAPADRPEGAEEVRRSLDAIVTRSADGSRGLSTQPLAAAPATDRLPEPSLSPSPSPPPSPPSRAGRHRPRSRGALPWVVALGSGIAIALALLTLYGALYGGSRPESSGVAGASATLRPSPTGSQAPSTASPVPSTSTPTTSGSISGSIPAAFAALVGIVEDVGSSGAVDGRLAKDLQHGVDEVVRALDKGDGEKVLRSLGEIRDRLDRGVERGEISPEDAHRVSDAVQNLASAIGGNAEEDD